MNRVFCAVTLSVTAGLVPSSTQPARALDLVKDGKPCSTILIADDASAYQKWSADWLQQYVQKATGARLEIVPETKAPAGTRISVGHTQLARAAGIKSDDLRYDGHRLVVRSGVLYLLGRDDTPMWDKYPAPQQSCAQGTVRAVTTFLSDVVGVRWYLPGPDGVVVPFLANLAVPDRLDKTVIPAIAYAAGPYPDPVAAYANNARMAFRAQLYGGHSWYVHVPAREDAGESLRNIGTVNYYRDHPEYFRMDENGKRTAAGGHLCTSHADVRRIMVQEMRKTFDAGFDAIELGASDGWQPCLCPDCAKLRVGRAPGSYSREQPCEEIWDMHLSVINELRKSHPRKYVMAIAYGPARWPSQKINCLPDNVIVELAGASAEQLEAWQGRAKAFTDYQTYWWEEDCNSSLFAPPFSPEWLQTTMRQYHHFGVMGIYGGPRVCWGLSGPLFYGYCQMLAKPDLNLDKLLGEYCAGVFVEAGPSMERFFRVLHTRTALAQEFNCKRFANSYPVEDAFTALYPPAVVDHLDRLLGNAESKATSERAQGWVRHTRDCFDGLKTIARMFAAKRAFELRPTRELLLGVKVQVEAFEQWRARIFAYSADQKYLDRWFPAYEALCGCLLANGDKYEAYYYSPALVRQELAAIVKGEKSARRLGIGGFLGHNEMLAPITWDFDKMLAALGRPQEEKKVVVRLRARALTPNGGIDPAEWQTVPGLTLVRYQSPDTAIKEGTGTTVRILYDAERLYVRYECGEPRPDGMKLKSVGRDGNVYGLDEVELCLNPEGSNRKCLHLMAAPVKDAFYDERIGYIDDPVHPNYATPDLTWNPEWRYAFAVDKENRRWTLEMIVPFKSLNLPPPMAGSVWLANFCRVRRADGGEELFSWVAETFGSDPALFGELTFSDREGKAPASRKPRTQAASGEAGAVGSAGTRFIRNGGFEEVDQAGQPVGWTLSSYPDPDDPSLRDCVSVSADKAHSGKHALRVDFRNLVQAKSSKNSQIILSGSYAPGAIAGLRGQAVTLSFWINYDHIAEDAVGCYFPGPLLSIRASAKGGQTPAVMPLSVQLTRDRMAAYGIGTPAQVIGKWVRIEQRGTIPAEAETVDLRIEHVAGPATVKDRNTTAFWIDDIALSVPGK